MCCNAESPTQLQVWQQRAMLTCTLHHKPRLTCHRCYTELLPAAAGGRGAGRRHKGRGAGHRAARRAGGGQQRAAQRRLHTGQKPHKRDAGGMGSIWAAANAHASIIIFLILQAIDATAMACVCVRPAAALNWCRRRRWPPPRLRAFAHVWLARFAEVLL